MYVGLMSFGQMILYQETWDLVFLRQICQVMKVWTKMGVSATDRDVTLPLGTNKIKLFILFTNVPNKLECLSPEGLASLV